MRVLRHASLQWRWNFLSLFAIVFQLVVSDCFFLWVGFVEDTQSPKLQRSSYKSLLIIDDISRLEQMVNAPHKHCRSWIMDHGAIPRL